ncbi:hypothetical protein FB567DRAFT_633590 [Paraphoma chrysanthemicola]|uniref:Uncharacterized protein n=1 Tax=Paraphoma chrysanthemicola TaxID=798071 RepID=A0A8K0QTU5_9PLEO|nr:hypothetical protein FB567DRAFT_633590 [Paraphoma chrysanthemicola]
MAVIHYDQAPTSENTIATSVLTRATKYGPTVFPLLFASVVGQATHAILRWRLEKGERIEVLDTLATSTSLTNTVTSQFRLRQISVLSVVLVVIWALSPVGGQASIRQMSVETVRITTPSKFRYTVPAWIFPNIQGTGLSPIVNSMYTAATAASSKTRKSPVDAWGNVKIPKIERYEDNKAPYNDHWYNSSMEDDDLAKYSSLVGIPIDGIQNGTTTTDYEMNLQTMYTQLECTSSNRTVASQWTYETPPDAKNITGFGGYIWWSENRLKERLNQTSETLKPMNLNYVSNSYEPQLLSCKMTSTYVEAQVSCVVNSTCRVNKLRRSQLAHLPPALTLLDIGLKGEEFTRSGDLYYVTNWWSVVKGFITSLGVQEMSNAGDRNIIQRYLKDPSLTITNPFMDGTPKSDSNTTFPSDEEFSDRFGQLLNTYVASISNLFTMSGRMDNSNSFSDKSSTFMPPQISVGGRPGNISSSYNWTGEHAKSKVWSTEGFKHEHTEIIKAHRSWAITLAIASVVLIAFSLVAPIVRHFLTIGADIAMNFSSLATRNKSHAPIPTSGSFLPAADRFRLLKDLRLRFADAGNKSDVGNLVIAAQGVEDVKYSGVRKGRLYE